MSRKIETALVTGHGGFIGSNLCIRLIEGGIKHLVCIDDRLPGFSEENEDDILFTADEYNTKLTMIHANLCDTAAMKTVAERIKGIDAVFHLAALSHVDRSLEAGLSFWHNQVVGTYVLFDALREVKPKVIINQITDEAYGEAEGVGFFAEGAKFNPRPPYACSKVAQYYVGRSAIVQHNLPIISTFPVNNYGPRQYPEKLIPKFITLLLRGQKVPLMKSSHYQRDWIPVSDMCDALVLLAEKGHLQEDYNIGVFNHHTNLDITRKILKILGLKESMIEIVPDRAVHDSRYAVSNGKMINHLGWNPNKTDFDKYLEYTVEWYKHNSLL